VEAQKSGEGGEGWGELNQRIRQTPLKGLPKRGKGTTASLIGFATRILCTWQFYFFSFSF
jgi:hypothetical protein